MMGVRYHPGTAPTALLKLLGDGSCRCLNEVAEALGLNARQVTTAASCLLRRDYLMRMAIGCYQLTEAGLDASRAGEVITSGPIVRNEKPNVYSNSLRQRAWRAMRIRRRFTVPDLVADAANDDDRQATGSIQGFLSALRRVGVVTELPVRAKGTANGTNGFKQWSLSKDVGPLAPILTCKGRTVHDPNTGKDLPCKLA